MKHALNRRHFMTRLSGLAAGLMASPASAEPPPETAVIRLPESPAACQAPLYLAEDLLGEEGFTEVRYVPATSMTADLLADGEIDFDLEDGFDYLPILNAGKSTILLAGSHVGCMELRANDSIQGVLDLKGKTNTAGVFL